MMMTLKCISSNIFRNDELRHDKSKDKTKHDCNADCKIAKMSHLQIEFVYIIVVVADLLWAVSINIETSSRGGEKNMNYWFVWSSAIE